MSVATLSNQPLIELPPPRMTGGVPLMEAIAKRHSTRAFRTDDLPLQEVSNILWAAAGHSRPYGGVGIHASGCRTSPGAHNCQEIDIHVASAHGLHLYDPHRHALVKLLDQDIRTYTAHETQPFVPDAPLNLIYVSDTARMEGANDWDLSVFPWADTAVVVENVYLYCASEGLATVCRALFDRPALTEVMRLRPQQLVTFHQLVGYKKPV
jgi:nitroreductase